CDAQDGVTDGVVDDPRRCTFDPGALQCKGADEATCLTPAQVNTARMLYAAQVNPATKRKIDGLQRGSELGWSSLGWPESARAPGMGHCGGGDGPNTFDMVGALEQWVEQGKAPDQILASHSTGGAVDRTRPLCPYPQVAVYKGSGSTREAASFVCKAQ